MADPKVRLNSRAIDKLLKGPGVKKELKKRVDRAAAAAGPGYEGTVTVGNTRALGRVSAETPQAARDNARNHTLMRVRDQLRG
jgi:hypothetical protein